MSDLVDAGPEGLDIGIDVPEADLPDAADAEDVERVRKEMWTLAATLEQECDGKLDVALKILEFNDDARIRDNHSRIAYNPEANTLGLKLTEADEPSGEGPWWSP